jgi:hypothetical protein
MTGRFDASLETRRLPLAAARGNTVLPLCFWRYCCMNNLACRHEEAGNIRSYTLF